MIHSPRVGRSSRLIVRSRGLGESPIRRTHLGENTLVIGLSQKAIEGRETTVANNSRSQGCDPRSGVWGTDWPQPSAPRAPRRTLPDSPASHHTEESTPESSAIPHSLQRFHQDAPGQPAVYNTEKSLYPPWGYKLYMLAGASYPKEVSCQGILKQRSVGPIISQAGPQSVSDAW